MDSIILLVLAVVWLSVSALWQAARQRPGWRVAGKDRRLGQLLRSLEEIRHALFLVVVVLSVAVTAQLLQVLHDTMGFEVLWTVVLGLLGTFLAGQLSVQDRILGMVQQIITKYGQYLGFIAAFLKLLEPAARWLFPDYPYFRNKQELSQIVQQHHTTHQVLSPTQWHQLNRLLTVDEKPVAPFVVPLKEAPMVRVDDTVGPLLLSELHSSAYMSFPVYSRRRAKIVGVLDQGVAVSHATGSAKVTAIMEERVIYLPHDATYAQALQTFIETSSPISVIIDGENQPVGVLYVQDILRDLFERSKENE